MRSIFGAALFVAGTLAEHQACSQAVLWSPAIFSVAKTYVKYNNQVYQNKWYATSSDLIGSSDVWELLGECSDSSDLIVNCKGFDAWQDFVTYTQGSITVTHNNRLWTNVYYAGPGNEPGVAELWTPLGTCESEIGGEVTAPVATTRGPIDTVPPLTTVTERPKTLQSSFMVVPTTTVTTASTTTSTTTSSTTTVTTTTAKQVGTDAAGALDCSGVNKWSGQYTYKTAGELAHYKNGLYKVAWYNQGVKPDTLNGWTYVGACATGTNTLGVPSDGAGLGPVGEARLCSCCKMCASAYGTTPQCIDNVTDEWDCLYTWCPDYNTFDADTCQKVTDNGMLEWYSGELVDGHQSWPDRVFIPYIDAALGKIPKLTDVHAATGVTHFVLAFITASGTNCKGGFGSASVGKGPTWWSTEGEINMYSQVNALRKLGGDAIGSLGGASGVELADHSACQGDDAIVKLKAAYDEVLDVIKQTVLDFDIEGPAISSANRNTGWKNRFEVVNLITAERPNLRVWWTLPTFPTGLTEDGKLFITDMMTAGTRFDLINLMTMDYGDADAVCSVNGVPDMHLCEQMAVDSVAQNLFDIAKQLGKLSTYGWTVWSDAYPNVGSTTMIGVNDVATEVYSLEDVARSMKVWKSEKNIKVISQWSVARDSPCPDTSASAICSGRNLQVNDYDFMRGFVQFQQ